MPIINPAKWRAWATPLVAITFVVISVTGVFMLSDGRGGNARELHELAGVLFIAAALVHLVVNWRAFLARCRRRVVLASIAGAAALSLLVMLFAGPDKGREGERHTPRARSGLHRLQSQH